MLENKRIGIVPSIPVSLMYGGGETQVAKTAAALKARGLDISFLHWEDESAKFDLLHIFGAKYWQTPIIELAHGKGIPIVLSTISYSPPSWKLSLRSKLRTAFTRACPFIPTTNSLLRGVMDSVSLFLPNSEAEANFLQQHFAIPVSKIRVVPNAADDRFSQADPQLFRSKYGITDEFAICVGKIEPRKNQLALVRAFQGWNKRLVLIGDAIANVRPYFEEVLRIAGVCANITHIPRLPHESGLLASAYAASSAHVLLGSNETPGLVNLEAGLAGTNLAVLDCPPVREYLSNHAVYIRDLSPDSVRGGIEQAWTRPRTAALRELVLEKYSWPRVAELTAQAYAEALAKPCSGGEEKREI